MHTTNRNDNWIVAKEINPPAMPITRTITGFFLKLVRPEPMDRFPMESASSSPFPFPSASASPFPFASACARHTRTPRKGHIQNPQNRKISSPGESVGGGGVPGPRGPSGWACSRRKGRSRLPSEAWVVVSRDGGGRSAWRCVEPAL
jgi:hypothetical protein